MMKKIAILGLGDMFQGDRGAAYYVLKSVANEISGEHIHISYLGDNPNYAGGLLYETDLAIIVGALNLSGVPGAMHVWNGRVFEQHAVWLAGEDPAIDRLLAALARADLAGGLPRKLLFVWIEPKETHGYQISKPVRGAIAMATRRIRKEIMLLALDRIQSRQELASAPPEVACLDY
jgi:hydrogenase maturation protease